MRFAWILTIICTLMSMGLLMIVLSQIQVLVIMTRDSDKLPNEIKRLDGSISNLGPFKDEFQLLLDMGNKDLQSLEASLAAMGPEMEKKKADGDTCYKEKKKIADELASVEKERTEIEANSKSESETWKKEIESLKSQLVEYRPICDHVKNNTVVMKLCGKKEQPVQPAARR